MMAAQVAIGEPRGSIFGIVLKLASGMCFVVLTALVKWLSSRYPAGEIVFFRSAAALPILVAFSYFGGASLEVLKTNRPTAHVLRGVVGCSSMVLSFSAFALLPLLDAQALAFLAPVFTLVLAVVFKERVNLSRVVSTVLGFAGVAIIIGAPSVSWQNPTILLGIVFGLSGAALTALSLLLIRGLTRTETTGAIATYFVTFSAIGALATLPFGWALPTVGDTCALLACGVVGAAAHILMTAALARAEASLLAPFDYFAILFTLTIGYVVFDEWPTFPVVLGVAVISLAGLLAIWAEHGQRGGAQQPTTP